MLRLNHNHRNESDETFLHLITLQAPDRESFENRFASPGIVWRTTHRSRLRRSNSPDPSGPMERPTPWCSQWMEHIISSGLGMLWVLSLGRPRTSSQLDAVATPCSVVTLRPNGDPAWKIPDSSAEKDVCSHHTATLSTAIVCNCSIS